jgi:MFS family permease
VDSTTRHNFYVESFFSAFNGVFLGLALFVSPVVAVVGLEANPLELTVLVCAYPFGALLGPMWVSLGRWMGMKNLVTFMAASAGVPMLFLFWVHDALWFTVLVTLGQLLVSAMRMGQSSLYSLTYPEPVRGRVLGWLTFWTYVTMVPCVLLTGWLLDKSQEMYRILYPLAGVCELIAAVYYAMLQVPVKEAGAEPRKGFRGNWQKIERILAQDRLYLFFQIAFFLAGSAFFMSRHVIILLTRDTFRFSAFELAFSLSVLPQLVLALSSPVWGRILDAIGIMRCRLLISGLMTGALASYFCGLYFQMPALIYLGAVLQGVSEGGGQLTWFLASTLFARKREDVPLYNGIHFVLNGTRGLILPWVGSILFVVSGTGAVLVATLVSFAALPIVLRAMTFPDDRLKKKRRPPEHGVELGKPAVLDKPNAVDISVALTRTGS